jgi:hypothetical protein
MFQDPGMVQASTRGASLLSGNVQMDFPEVREGNIAVDTMRYQTMDGDLPVASIDHRSAGLNNRFL